MKNKHIAIIGAGLTGLVIAEKLKEHANITIFEKSRGVGGRLSTRRIDDIAFDHGAQYFTARSSEFKEWLKPLINNNLISQWHPKYALFDNTDLIARKWPTEEPRYVGVPTMNFLAKHLASQHEIKQKTLINKIERSQKWTLFDSNNIAYPNFDFIILAIPSYQALQLLGTSSPFYDAIANIKMTPCFTAMLHLQHIVNSSFDCAHIKNHDIGWIALNHTKPERSPTPSIIIQASTKYSCNFIDHCKEEVLHHLSTQATSFVEFDPNDIIHQELHLWRFANNQDFSVKKSFVDGDEKIAIAGDFCQGGRVEGAFLSAIQTAEEVLNLLA